MNGSHLFPEEVQEPEAEVRGTRKLGDIERAKEHRLMVENNILGLLLVSNEGGVVVCFGLVKRFFIKILLNVVFIGFMVDGEASSFIEHLQVATNGI